MISSRPLFSGVIVFFWEFAVFAALLTGFMHLPIEEHLPFALPNIPLIRVHGLFSCLALFVAFYAVIIWLIKGRKKYTLTLITKIGICVYFFALTTGLLLIANMTNILPLYGLYMPIVKLLHCFCAFVLSFLILATWFRHMLKPVIYLRKKGETIN